MNGLRAILLLAGLLFIAALIWLERRRPSRVQPEADVRSGREEPAFGFQDAEVASTGSGTPRGPDPGRALPLIDWSTPVGAAPPDPPLMEVAELTPVRTLPDTTASAGVAASQGEQAQPLRVELPAEEVRRIVSLRIVAARQNRIAGRSLRQGLTGAGFQHGEFGIFHLAHSDGRAVLSAASLVRPGILDPESMDFQSFSGINLFAVLPGPLKPEATLERLTAVATELAQRVEGRVQDERGMPFDSAHPAAWRERALSTLGTQAGQAD
ncbi:MAG: cell division protein ZipA C-terminal FtsZ-binding domain-containing protein [Steroidobacteraceae bacterium]